MASTPDPAQDSTDEAQVIELTPEQAWEQFDADVRKTLQISGAEFARKLNAGEFGDPDDNPTIMWFALECDFLQRAGFPR